jgi:hypothetical protein
VPGVAQHLDGVLEQPVGLAGELVEAVQQATGLIDGLEGLGELAEPLDGGVVQVGSGASPAHRAGRRRRLPGQARVAAIAIRRSAS